MSFYGWKPDPKTSVTLTFERLYGRGRRFKVTGQRASESELQTAVPRGHYVAQLHVDGVFFAKATDRDWRKAYKALEAEVRRLHEAGAVPA